MNKKLQIDSALRLIGTAQPPSGLERRVLSRLERPLTVQRGGGTAIHFISAAAIAASVVFAAAALAPSLRERAMHQGASAVSAPRTTAHPAGNFGAASAVHLPTEPVPVQPTPVNQGRGRARSDRELSPSSTHLPHGVAVPRRIAVPHRLHSGLSRVGAARTQAAVP